MKASREYAKPRKRRTLETMTYRELVNVLDRCFSEYIRLSAADEHGYIKCPTCGKVYGWRQMDLSHYCGRKHISVRWDERNVIAQCQSENRFQSGNIFKLRKVLVERYGEETVCEVEKLAVRPWAEDVFSLRLKISDWREKVKQLKIEKGLA